MRVHRLMPGMLITKYVNNNPSETMFIVNVNNKGNRITVLPKFEKYNNESIYTNEDGDTYLNSLVVMEYEKYIEDGCVDENGGYGPEPEVYSLRKNGAWVEKGRNMSYFTHCRLNFPNDELTIR